MRAILASILATQLLLPGSLRADDGGGELPSDRMIAAVLVSELLIPDLRLQLREDERLILSWPVHLATWSPRRAVELSAFGEPQYQPSTADLRVIAGARLGVMGRGLGGLVEGGALLGHDAGAGGVVGAGLLFGLDGRPRPGVAIVARASFLPDQQRRYDVAVDVTLATIADLIRAARN